MDLGAYLKPLLRMWWLILAAVLVATIASFLMLRRVPPTYQSRVLLMVGHALQNPNPIIEASRDGRIVRQRQSTD